MFCNYCGKPVDTAARFCPACGKGVTPGPAASTTPNRVARHLQILAILWIVYSALRFLRGGANLAGAGMISFLDNAWFRGQDFPLGTFLPPVLSVMGLLLLAMAVAGLAAGWGLIERRPWARGLALALGCVALLNPPFGTALGIFTLWVLLPQQSETEYREMSRS